MRSPRQMVAVAAAGILLFAAGCTSDDGEPESAPSELRPVPSSAAPAPAVDLAGLDGGRLGLGEAERPTVLVFFEEWCQLCADQQAEINAFAEKHQGVVDVIGVAGISTADQAKEYVAANKVPYPVGLDDTGLVWRAYAVSEAPLVAVVAQGGYLLAGLPAGVEDLTGRLDELLFV